MKIILGRMFWFFSAAALFFLTLTLTSGCQQYARANLSSADAIDRIALNLRTSADEYHGEIVASDSFKRDEVIHAFINRIQTDGGDDTADATAFKLSLDNIQHDRDVEGVRYVNTRETLNALTEVASGIRRLGVSALRISDDYKSYFEGLIADKSTQIKRGTDR